MFKNIKKYVNKKRRAKESKKIWDGFANGSISKEEMYELAWKSFATGRQMFCDIMERTDIILSKNMPEAEKNLKDEDFPDAFKYVYNEWVHMLNVEFPMNLVLGIAYTLDTYDLIEDMKTIRPECSFEEMLDQFYKGVDEKCKYEDDFLQCVETAFNYYKNDEDPFYENLYIKDENGQMWGKEKFMKYLPAE